MKTCGTGRFVNTGVNLKDTIDEEPYSQFSYLIVYRLLLRELPHPS